MSGAALGRCIQLVNGVELPRVGLGTFRSKGDEVKLAVHSAVRLGIRHIDTAAVYKNESEIAESLARSPISRDELFISSKISPYQQGMAKATIAVEEISQRLGTEPDLLLVHWPGASKVAPASDLNARLRLETWRVLEGLYKQGRVRAIGVSNYEESHLAELLELAEMRPMVNQIEVHPRYPNTRLRDACQAAGVAVVAYASLGCGELLRDSRVMEVARRVGKSPAQVLLRWALQKGCCVIPKSVHPHYIEQHTEDALLTWELPGQEMEALDAMEDGHKYCWDPSGVR